MKRCESCGQELPQSIDEQIADRMLLYQSAFQLLKKQHGNPPLHSDVLNTAAFLAGEELICLPLEEIPD